MTPELPAILYLRQRGIAHEVRLFPESTPPGAAAVAEALGFRARQMVKTLIFETAEGAAALVMLGGDQLAKSGHLKKALGSRNIRLASPKRVQALTGYDIGSIPPFHWQTQVVRSLLERSLLDEKALGVGAGQWGVEIIISPADLLLAAGADVAALARAD